MDFNDIIVSLKKGDISFLDEMEDYMINSIASFIKKSVDKEEILQKSFLLLEGNYSNMLFRIVYDMKAYEDFCRQYLSKNPSVLLDHRFFHEFLGSSEWSVEYVFDNIDYFLEVSLNNKETFVFTILRYCIYFNKDYLKCFVYHNNINIRGLVMIEVLENFAYLFKKIYPNILDYCIKYDKDGNVIEIMEQGYLSKIAVLSLNISEEQYYLLRDTILHNFDKNDIALELDKLVSNDEDIAKKILIKDIDVLFETSKNYKWHLFNKYSGCLNDDLLEKFKNKCEPFIDNYFMLQHMFFYELSDTYFEYVDKYLAMSTGAKCIRFVNEGSCTHVYQVGDYVLKYSMKKYSNDDEICPNLYLIAKNHEEIFVRDNKGFVKAAIEVQQYLSKPVMATQTKLIELFKDELEKNGYYYDDILVGGMCGTNCFYLNDYHDADCEDPELLPDWFKKDPIVLIDRDTVLKL